MKYFYTFIFFIPFLLLTGCNNTQEPIKETVFSTNNSLNTYNIYIEHKDYTLAKYEPPKGSYLASYFDISNANNNNSSKASNSSNYNDNNSDNDISNTSDSNTNTLNNFNGFNNSYISTYDESFSYYENNSNNVDKNKEIVEKFEKLVKTHAIYSIEIKLDSPFPSNQILTYYSKGKTPYISINPPENLENMFNINMLKKMAQSFGSLNIPMFVNFYQNPHINNFTENEYISFFKQAKVFFQIYAPNVAFIWSINSENVYELDKYYPGDFYVDWVGLNIYEITDSTSIKKVQAELDYFYQNFQSKKPININLGISHFNSKNVNYIINEKIKELNRFFSTIPKKYNRIKLINYINDSNFKYVEDTFQNFSITDNKKILNTYNKLIENSLFLTSVESNLQNTLSPQNLLLKFLVYEKDNTFFIPLNKIDELIFNLKVNDFKKEDYEIKNINNKNYYNLEEILNNLNYNLIIDEENSSVYINNIEKGL